MAPSLLVSSWKMDQKGLSNNFFVLFLIFQEKIFFNYVMLVDYNKINWVHENKTTKNHVKTAMHSQISDVINILACVCM